MDKSFVEWILGQTGLAGIAALAFWMLRQSYQERMADKAKHREDQERTYKERLEEQKAHREDMRSVVVDTRACIDRNSQALLDTMLEMRNLVRAIGVGIKE